MAMMGTSAVAEDVPGKAQKFDLVVQDAVFASKALGLTEVVIKALGGPAPKPKP